MTRALALTLFSVLALIAAACPPAEEPAAPPAPPPAPSAQAAAPPGQGREAAAANNAFALDLFKPLVAGARGGNVFFSPFSIQSALAMTAAGARGATADEMATVLHFAQAGPDPHAAFARLARALTGAKLEGGELKVANALWGQKGEPFAPEYLARVGRDWGGALRDLDFAGAAEKARETINAWVAEQTANRIRELLEPGSVSADTRLVLTNAIYFKGLWAEKFEAQHTRPGPFQLGGGATAEVPLMHGSIEIGYAEPTPELQIAELLYQGGELSMVVLLPKGPAAELVAALDSATLGGYLSRIEPRVKVEVTLPKWKATYRQELGGYLKALGMKAAFRGGADFSGISGGKGGLFIDKVFHQADIEVDEEGTVAAAATAVTMVRGISRTRVFRADRPFVFLLRHRSSGAILFLGLMVDPRPA